MIAKLLLELAVKVSSYLRIECHISAILIVKVSLFSLHKAYSAYFHVIALYSNDILLLVVYH